MLGEDGIQDLYNEISKLLDYLTTLNYEILLLPHSFKRSETSEAIEKEIFNLSKNIMDDGIFINEVYKRLKNKEKAHLATSEKFTYRTKGILKLTEFNITMRFHSMIGSLGAGSPCFVISWSHKYLEIMKEFGLEKYVIDGSDFNFQTHKKLIDKFIQDLVPNNSLVQQNLIRVKNLAEKNFDEIKESF